MIQWHKGNEVPLPPKGTAILIYCADLADDRYFWRGPIQAGAVALRHDFGVYAECVSSLFYEAEDGWWWAFAPAPPEGAE